MRTELEKMEFLRQSNTNDPVDEQIRIWVAAVDRYRRILAGMDNDLLESLSGNADLENIKKLALNMAYDIFEHFPGGNTDNAMKAIQAGIVERYGPQT